MAMSIKANLSLDQESVSDIVRSLKVIPGAALRASRRATSKTLTTLRRAVLRDIAGKAGIPQKILAGRVFIKRPTAQKNRGLLWVGVKPIPAHRLGEPRQTKKGVRVGRRSFPDAFIWQPGKTKLVFRRKDKRRLPIQLEQIELDSDSRKYLELARDRYPVVLVQEANFEIKKSLRKI